MLKQSILRIAPEAKVNVLCSSTLPWNVKDRDIDVYIKNFNRIPRERLNRIASACRSHQGNDPIYGTPVKKWILSGEIAERKNDKIQVTWKESQQQMLLMFEPEEVILGCDTVNLWLGRGATGPFTQQDDFQWVLDHFALCENGYAYRTAD